MSSFACTAFWMCLGALGIRGRSISLFADVVAGSMLLLSGANVPLQEAAGCGAGAGQGAAAHARDRGWTGSGSGPVAGSRLPPARDGDEGRRSATLEAF